LPGLNCGLCGQRSCADFAVQLEARPELIKRCIHLSTNKISSVSNQNSGNLAVSGAPTTSTCGSCGTCGDCSPVQANPANSEGRAKSLDLLKPNSGWKDSLGREFDFYLEHFPEDPGPREVMIPHNPMLTRELNIQVGDILIGRPLGMSCGCPITHCGVVMEVDARTGVIVWCVTGPLNPREKGFKDLGYYIAEAYEGIIKETRTEIKIGMRYFFQPKMCMLQWRHSGLVNYINKTKEGLQIRIEGLWIG